MEVVETFLGSGTVFPLSGVLISEPGFPIDLQLILDIPPCSKVKYPGLAISTLQATLLVPSTVSGVNLPPPTSVMSPTSPSQATFSVSIYV